VFATRAARASTLHCGRAGEAAAACRSLQTARQTSCTVAALRRTRAVCYASQSDSPLTLGERLSVTYLCTSGAWLVLALLQLAAGLPRLPAPPSAFPVLLWRLLGLVSFLVSVVTFTLSEAASGGRGSLTYKRLALVRLLPALAVG